MQTVFVGGRVEAAGATMEADDSDHSLFKIERTNGSPIYGEYIYQFLANEHDFNVEIAMFGYSDYRYLGSRDPTKRQSFSADEASTAQDLIRSYFLSHPPIYKQSFLNPRFTGNVSFRSDWVVKKSD
jgi:hypothetical protein